MRIVHKGATSQTVYLSVNDSASTTGGKKTGIAYNTAGLVASYTRNGAARTAITLATLASASAAWSSGGFVEVDATNEPGLYRCDVPDAAFASGVDSVVVQIGGATGMVWAAEEVQLTAVDLQDAVALGLSRIDAAISSRMATFTLPTNFSSLVINASGRIDVGTWLGAAVNALIGGRVDANAQVVGDKTGYTASTVSDKTGYALTAGEHTSIASDTQTGLTSQGYTATRAGYLDTLNGLVAAIWAAATRTLTAFGFNVTVGTNNDKTGYTASTVSDKTGYALTSAEHTNITADVWDATASSHNTAGTTGNKLNSAASAGDPWLTSVPGAYGAGTAGQIIGSLPGSVWDVAIASHTSAGSTGNKLNGLSGAAGSGALTVAVTVQNDALHPVAGAQFWVTTDSAGTNVVASGSSDAFGKVTVFLNAGTYYGWAAKPGETFTNPLTMVVS